MALLRAMRMGLGVALCLSAISCGGGGSGSGSGTTTPPPPPPASNTTSVIVDQGPSSNSVNTLFTSVTVCVPGSTPPSSNCQDIDHVQVEVERMAVVHVGVSAAIR